MLLLVLRKLLYLSEQKNETYSKKIIVQTHIYTYIHTNSSKQKF